MSEIILYMTSSDVEVLRTWINGEEAVAWIVAVSRDGQRRTWKAIGAIDRVLPQRYSLWHRALGQPTVPSGAVGVEDAVVLDTTKGWTQAASDLEGTTPWFGANLPGAYDLSFRELGVEATGSLARSGLSWLGDHFRPIGKAAPPEAKRWWERARRFVKREAVAVPWPSPELAKRTRAYVFPDAYAQMLGGRVLDVNPPGRRPASRCS